MPLIKLIKVFQLQNTANLPILRFKRTQRGMLENIQFTDCFLLQQLSSK